MTGVEVIMWTVASVVLYLAVGAGVAAVLAYRRRPASSLPERELLLRSAAIGLVWPAWIVLFAVKFVIFLTKSINKG